MTAEPEIASKVIPPNQSSHDSSASTSSRQIMVRIPLFVLLFLRSYGSLSFFVFDPPPSLKSALKPAASASSLVPVSSSLKRKVLCCVFCLLSFYVT